MICGGRTESDYPTDAIKKESRSAAPVLNTNIPSADTENAPPALAALARTPSMIGKGSPRVSNRSASNSCAIKVWPRTNRRYPGCEYCTFVSAAKNDLLSDESRLYEERFLFYDSLGYSWLSASRSSSFQRASTSILSPEQPGTGSMLLDVTPTIFW